MSSEIAINKKLKLTSMLNRPWRKQMQFGSGCRRTCDCDDRHILRGTFGEWLWSRRD